MDALAHGDRRAVLGAALELATGRRVDEGGLLAAATTVLHTAGFADGEVWRDTALVKLHAYVDVAARAPCGDTLEVRLAQARHLFDVGLFFEVHEVLEPAWLTAEGASKAWLQGVIQIAVAWHHYGASNLPGAASLARAAAAKLESAPPVWNGFPMGVASSAASAWAVWLEAGAEGRAPARPFVNEARE